MAQRAIGAPPLTSDERVLWALGQLRHEVNNGGFQQYFFNSAGDDFQEAMAAADETRQVELAELLRRAASLLGPPFPLDRADRQARLGGLSDEAIASLDELDTAYFAREQRVDLDAAMDALAARTTRG